MVNMGFSLWIGVFSLLVFSVFAENDYYGYRVIEVTASQKQQGDFLYDLYRNQQDGSHYEFFSLVQLNQPVYIAVSSETYSSLSDAFKELDLEPQVLSQDLHGYLEEERRLRTQRRAARNAAFNLNDWNTYEDIVAQLSVYASDCPSGFSCEIRSIGTTLEGRSIETFKISGGGSNRPIIWMDSLIHSNEWLTGATVVKTLDHLIYQYGSDPEVNYLLDRYDVFVIPVLNPDGYVFTWTNQRTWRKNRAPTSGPCRGIDLNRNYNWDWCEEGASSFTCDTGYCGPSPDSELETQAVVDEVIRQQNSQGIIALISYHTIGRMILHPWGNTINNNGQTCERPDDYEDVNAVANAFANAIEDTFGTTWTRGTICETIYAATGGTIDWVKGAEGVKYSFAPELRGAWIASANDIDPSFQENWNGIMAMIREIERRA